MVYIFEFILDMFMLYKKYIYLIHILYSFWCTDDISGLLVFAGLCSMNLCEGCVLSGSPV